MPHIKKTTLNDVHDQASDVDFAALITFSIHKKYGLLKFSFASKMCLLALELLLFETYHRNMHVTHQILSINREIPKGPDHFEKPDRYLLGPFRASYESNIKCIY